MTDQEMIVEMASLAWSNYAKADEMVKLAKAEPFDPDEPDFEMGKAERIKNAEIAKTHAYELFEAFKNYQDNRAVINMAFGL